MSNEVEQKNMADKLRKAREQAGLSQGQVAKRLKYNRPTISEIEAGRRKVSAQELSLFAEMYEVNEEWLLGKSLPGVDPVVELAARELTKLKKKDLDTILDLLKSMRNRETR
jgi:transcriptional regulator with XRE-family HTH domain